MLLVAGVVAIVIALALLTPGKEAKEAKVQGAGASGTPIAAMTAATGAAKPDAVEILRKAEEKYAAGRRAYESGLAFTARRLCGEAAELYKQYLELIPGDLRALSAMAGAALYAGQVDAAREAYRQALEEGAEWLAGAHIGYAVLLHDYDRNYNAAQEHQREAAGLDPDGEVGKRAREMLGKMTITE